MLDDMRRARTWWRGSHWWSEHPRARQGSAYIPAWMRRAVMIMDRSRCLYCGSGLDPHIDHITPWRFGGRTRLTNLAVLCAYHNRVKGAYWESPAETVYYPHGDPVNLPLAGAIARWEYEARWSPARWCRLLLAAV